MSKKTILAGAFILTAAGFITRFLGFFYRIAMVNAIGTEGMGLFQLMMPIYSLAWSLTSSGFTTTVSRLTAQAIAEGKSAKATRILYTALFFSVSLSICVSFLLYLKTPFISNEVLKDSRTYHALRLICLCFPFMAAGSCIRGYFFGRSKTVVPALSQILEQCTRIFTVFALCFMYSPDDLSSACMFAASGVVLGEIVSCLFTIASFLHQKEPKNLARTAYAFPILPVLTMALPLTANRVIGSILSAAENILIPQRLAIFYGDFSAALATYGSLSAAALPLLMFPSSLLTAVATALIPEITTYYERQDCRRLKKAISTSFRCTFLCGIGVCAVFLVFSSDICMSVFGEKQSGEILRKMSFLCPLLYFQITLSGVLNGLGEHIFLLKTNIISSAINISSIWFLMPLLGIDAFILGWLAGLIVTFSLGICRLHSLVSFQFKFWNWIIKPFLCATSAALGCQWLKIFLPENRLFFILPAIAAFFVYFILIFSTGCVTINEFQRLFSGWKRPCVRRET